MRERCISFLTAVAVSHGATDETVARLVPTEVHFRDFDTRRSRPTCARNLRLRGSAKIEALDRLVRRLDGTDPPR
jgi:predicted house-cleaning NTP pyrophosphatase (Maf/HAM1 superfamily)